MYACLDLGSNSFHLLIARTEGQGIDVVERFSEKVQLGEGLSATGSISPAAFRRGIDCLRRFRELMDHYPLEMYWALGTNALRVASNAEAFIAAARSGGIDVAVISGLQEAALVYAGVVTALPDNDEDRLVIDIGGGSTELILGQGRRPLIAHSLLAGCVSWRDNWFETLPRQAALLEAQLEQAVVAAAAIFRQLPKGIRRQHWSACYASSGTARMLTAICQENGLAEGQITAEAMQILKPMIIDAALSGELLPGLVEGRRDLLLPGWAILSALMEVLGIERILFSASALREGMLDFMVANNQQALTALALPPFKRGSLAGLPKR